MPDEIGVPQGNADGGPPLGGGPLPSQSQSQQHEQPRQESSRQEQQTLSQEQRVVSVPTHAMKRIKDEAREAGRGEALSMLASSAGFANSNELVAALGKLRGGNGARQQQQEQPQQYEQQQQQQQQQYEQQPQQHEQPRQESNDLLDVKNARRELARYERQMEKLARERDQFQSQYTEASNQTLQLQEALDAKDAEMSLREVAVTTGVKDVDYALRLLTRELEAKSEAELASFDERAFFSGLRQSKPYLFGESIVPASTGTGGGAPPPAPRPGQVARTAATAAQTDVKKMNPQEFQEHLRKRGLNPNM